VDGVLFNKSLTRLIQCPGAKAGSYLVPNSVASIGDYGFYNCTSLTSVTLPNSVTGIGARAFYHCTSLTSLTIPSSVTSIGDYAFSACSSLTSAAIPNSVTNIGNSAFYSCYSLTNVTIGNNVASIGDEAFSSCHSLTAITVAAPNSVYSSVDGVLFNKNLTRLIQFPGAKAESYIVPNSVTNIGNSAFYSCYSLTNVTIGNNVASIGVYAFFDCSSLTSVTIGNSVISIGNYAFYYCSSMTEVYFQGNAPSLGGSYVFYDANNATVYYLAGTTGWGPTFGGRPTVVWNSQPQTSVASIGVRTNQFGFTITGTSNLVVVVEACTNLANPFWSPLKTNTLSGNSFYFSDPQWTNHPRRFYRLRSP
jgi:hypothetical protein